MLGNGVAATKWLSPVVQVMNPVRSRISDGPALYWCCRYSNTRRPLLDMGFDTWLALLRLKRCFAAEKSAFRYWPDPCNNQTVDSVAK
jgi:hypothetical protein